MVQLYSDVFEPGKRRVSSTCCVTACGCNTTCCMCILWRDASSGQDRSVTLKAGMVVWLFGAHISSNGSAASESLASSSSLTEAELALMAAYAHSSALIVGALKHCTIQITQFVRLCNALPLHLHYMLCCLSRHTSSLCCRRSRISCASSYPNYCSRYIVARRLYSVIRY